MKQTNLVKPSLTVLNQAQTEQVHDYSLRILSSVGVRLDSEQARQLFAQASSPTTINGDRVRIPRELVDWALEAAPSSVEVYDRTGKLACRLPGEARFGVGVAALYYQDPMSDEVTPFSRTHMAAITRLGGALNQFDLISTPGIVQDVPPKVQDLYGTLEMTANTTKPLVILVSDEDAFPGVLDLLAHLHGDGSAELTEVLSAHPFIVPYFNPITPLVINKGTVDKMLVASERGLPYIYSNYGMAGASTPITPAGVLAVLNAELLAGLVLSQLIKEGQPVILGNLPAYFDMRGMGSFYDAKSYLLDLACAEMMAHYRLPHAGTSGSGVGWAMDLLAAGHLWFNHLITCIGKVGLAPFVGDNLGSKAFSPATIVYANEVIAQARLFAQGFALDDDAVALDEIAQVGPGGNFLMSDLTLKNFRQAYYRSDIFPNLTMEEWLAKGAPHADSLVRSHTRELLNTAKAPEDHARLMARGQEFITSITAG